MHTERPPLDALATWLKSYPSINDRYGHLLLEQIGLSDETLEAAFRPYFESAHFDARQHFHEQIGMELHPDSDGNTPVVCYPNSLPPTARRGLFGEVMAGMLTEAYYAEFIGGHAWSIPVFLFREHADAEKYLYDLARNPDKVRATFGRFGSDFLGVSLGASGEIIRFIAGEAKWRLSLTQSTVDSLMSGALIKGTPDARDGKGVWSEINKDTQVPHGLRQLQRILIKLDADGFAAAILSLDQALILKDPTPLPRTNLVVLAGNGAARRQSGDPLLQWEEMPSEYTSKNDLQVIELILTEGERFIDGLYSRLWTK
jgi:hypothetical protein